MWVSWCRYRQNFELKRKVRASVEHVSVCVCVCEREREWCLSKWISLGKGQPSQPCTNSVCFQPTGSISGPSLLNRAGFLAHSRCSVNTGQRWKLGPAVSASWAYPLSWQFQAWPTLVNFFSLKRSTSWVLETYWTLFPYTVFCFSQCGPFLKVFIELVGLPWWLRW